MPLGDNRPMLSRVLSAAVNGIEADPVEVNFARKKFRERVCPRIGLAVFVGCLQILITGCAIPTHSRVDDEQIVATRTNLEGNSVEKVIAIPTEHFAFMPITPEGMEVDHISHVSWKYYLERAKGDRTELRFLRRSGGAACPWELITCLPQSGYWAGVIYLDKSGSTKKIEHSYRIICFNQNKIVSERTIACADYGKFGYDAEKNCLVYEISKAENFKTRVVARQFYLFPNIPNVK